MDTDSLVEFQIDAGQRLAVQLIRDGFVVDAALWVKTAEEGLWFLYVASPLVEEKGLAAVYRLLQSSHRRLQGTPLSLADIKLIGRNSPIAQDVLAVLAQVPGVMATRLGGKQLGGVAIDEAYVYAACLSTAHGSSPMTQEEDLRELFRLLNRGTDTVHRRRYH